MNKTKLSYILYQISQNPEEKDIKNLKLMVECLRTSSGAKRANQAIEYLIEFITKDPNVLDGLKTYLHTVFKNKKFHELFTESGITQDNSFFSEIKKRIAYKYLPYQPDEDTIDYILTNVFYKNYDHKWLGSVSNKNLYTLFNLLDIQPLSEVETSTEISKELLFAFKVLVYKIAGNALSFEIIRMVPECDNLENPFLKLQNEVYRYVYNVQKGTVSRDATEPSFLLIDNHILACLKYIETAENNKGKFGISLRLSIQLLRLKEQLKRLHLLLDNYTHHESDTKYDSLIFYKEILKAHCDKNRIRPFIRETTSLIAYQVTQHTGKTGEHYITNSNKEYWDMLKSASGGGLIVAFLCIIKMQLSLSEASQLGYALMYSLNYSLGFILIYFLHFTLATKQPAMTAAALAKSFTENTGDNDKYAKFSELFARLFRSQFIAFVGNVIIVFPVALALCYIWLLVFGNSPVPFYKGKKILDEINMFYSPALLHASIAGFYLFISGLISGAYINNNIFNRVAKRIEKHPALQFLIGEKNCRRIALFYEKHIGGISGNFWFGVFLGSTGTIGAFIGLPIDIRHITFAAGNFAMSLFSLNYSVSVIEILIVTLTIGLIGFLNFIVSFGLSLFVAMQSRKISVFEILKMVVSIKNRFISNPKEFFMPVG
jgi:site-specific recombinase